MRVLGFDCETTGLDLENDRILEIGAVVWDTDRKRSLLEFSSFVYEENFPEINAGAMAKHGLEKETVIEFARKPMEAFTYLDHLFTNHDCKYIIAHNGTRFDEPMVKQELQRNMILRLTIGKADWIDTRIDIEYPSHIESRKLTHLAAEHGFLNPFPHRAIDDVKTMLKIMSHYNFENILAYHDIPTITVRALVTYEQRERAKEQRFSWQKIDDQVFHNSWVKKMKQTEYEREKALWPFQTEILT